MSNRVALYSDNGYAMGLPDGDALTDVAGNIVAKASTIISGATLSSGGWSLASGLYEYSYSNDAILTSSIVTIIPRNASRAYVKAAKILPESTVSAGAITLYAEVAPTNDITIDLIIGI